MAAEWEPALGVLVTWPLRVPHALVVEIARDSRLYLLVADEAALAEAERWLAEWDVDERACEFVFVPQSDDASWVRDWGAHPVFTADGRLRLADPDYRMSTPMSGLGCDDPLTTPFDGSWGDDADYDVSSDDAAPQYVAAALVVEHLALPIALTGGNVQTDGRGLAISSCVLLNENRALGFPESQFRAITREFMGLDRYAIIRNFEERGIQHVDCLLKVLDENRLFVMRPPRDHPSYVLYESIVTEDLARLRTAHGRPFEILRLDTARYAGDRLAAYSNSIIVNDKVYVPLFGIAEDELALQQWRDALPGHTVKGFEFVLADEPTLSPEMERYGTIGWDAGDALHCRTRAVWDPNMLWISVTPIDPGTVAGELLRVRARIVDYSRAGLVADELAVYWRTRGATNWDRVPLERDEATGEFEATLPGALRGTTIEYFVRAADASGRSETQPATAPAAFLRATIKGG